MTYMAYNRVLVIQEVDVAYRTTRASNSNGVSELRTGESLEAPKDEFPLLLSGRPTTVKHYSIL